MRKNPKDRKTELLQIAVRLAHMDGYQHVTRESIAYAAHCSTGLVNKYFGTMKDLKRAIIRAGVAQDDLAIIAQGLAAGDPQAQKAKDEVKRKALEALL